MTEFNVKIGKGKKPAGAERGAQPPVERKPIHPGLQQIATSITCLKCGTFLEWSPFGEDGQLWSAACSCGLWFQNHRLMTIRWIRWSSAPFMPDGREVFSPEK